MDSQSIVFLIGNYKNGGVARRSTTLANEISRKGWNVTILVTGELGSELPTLYPKVRLVCLNDFIQEHSGNPIIVKDVNFRKHCISWLRKLRLVTSFIPLLKKYCSSKISDLLHGNTLRYYFLLNHNSTIIAFATSFVYETYCATKGLNCKIIFAEKNASQLENRGLSQAKEEASKALHYAKACVFQTYDELAQYDSSSLNKPVVIRNPIRPDLPQPYHGSRKKIIVNFCRLNKQKNLPLLIEAFALLHTKFPDFKLEIYGNVVSQKEQELKDELINLIKQKGLDDSVKILPPCLDIHEKIIDYAMFVSSSDFEGLSNSMLEAMAIGLPCVCTDCLGGGAREIIRDGENGLLVPVKDTIQLCNAMRRFIQSPELTEKCGQNAARIREELSADKIAQEWLQVIDKVVQP